MDVYSFMYNCILYIGSVIFLRDLITYSLSPVSLSKPEDQAMLGIGPHVNIMSGSCAVTLRMRDIYGVKNTGRGCITSFANVLVNN